jgi:ABC-2 type transport system permease protein
VATGCAFAAVGAFAAQLTAGGRTATGIAAAFLGLVYMLRAIGDSTGGGRAWVSWLSPIGWSQQVRPFADERWPVLLLLLAFTIVVGTAAFVLAARRDLGAGLLADRPGPARASPRLLSPIGLAWRLQRGTLVAWVLAVALIGAIVGIIASQIGGMLDSPQARDLITKLGGTRALTDAYLALELGALGSIVSIFGMQAAMRLRSEEIPWRADLILSTATGRVRWLVSHLSLAVAGTVGVILIGGLASALGYAAATRDASVVGGVVAGAAVQIPAACVMIGIVVAVFGLAPRFTVAAWGFLVAFLLIGEFGAVFNLPQWVMNVSPFAHTPRLPGGELQLLPLVGLLVVAAAFTGIGIAGFTRRDIS